MKEITFGSVCSGIEAASVAWEPLGFWAEWFSEIEAFPSAVLAHHWPDVPNLGDMLTLPALVDAGEIAAPDVLVGGTPCQAFSVAGNRESLADARGGLTLAYVELADAIDRQRAREGQEPCVIVWENVPGVLSTKDNAFGCFLAGLAGEDVPLQPPGKRWTNAGLVLGPKRAIAWRILDAQYFGVAQRRRRVFVVASARNGFDPSEILFEREGVRRDSAPCREARQEAAGDAGTGFAVAGALDSRVGAGGFPRSDGAMGGHVIPSGFRMVAFGEYADDNTASAMKARDYKDATDLAVSVALRGREGGATAELGGEVATALRASTGGGDKPHVLTREPVVFDTTNVTSPQNGSNPQPGDPCHTLAQGQHPPLLASMAVRRLTPTECERLQGFPDGYTGVPYRNKPAADGPRYKALGNSMAVPCMAFIGRRIAAALR